MRIGTIDGRVVLVTSRGTVDVEKASGGRFGPDAEDIYVRWDSFREWAAAAAVEDAPAEPLDLDRLGPPVPRPGQLFALGLTYRDHAAEQGIENPEFPTVFTKFRGSITGPRGSVVLAGPAVDWEVELVVVIGRHTRDVAAADAWDHVAGLTAGQDITERAVQFAGTTPQFSLGKSFPGFAPMGPWLVTLDELRADGHDPDALDLGCSVNGEPVQQANTADLIFGVPELVARLSAVLPLEPGDVIYTGTPAGVGATRDPRWFLKPGDELVSSIAGIGELRQTFIAPGNEA